MSVPAGVPITFEELLQVTANAPDHPAITDYGVPFAAAARTSARALDRDIYHGVHAKAAALLDTLLRHPWLEHHQATAAWTALTAMLAFNGWHPRPDAKRAEVADLLARVAGPGVAIADLARELRALTERSVPSAEDADPSRGD